MRVEVVNLIDIDARIAQGVRHTPGSAFTILARSSHVVGIRAHAEPGKFAIILAMSAIGLNTDIRALITNGLRPIILGLSCWFAVASVSLIVQHIIGIL